MPSDVLIIWPDSEAAAELEEAILRSDVGLTPRRVLDYPSAADLPAALNGPDGPVSAAIIGMDDSGAAVETLAQMCKLTPEVAPVAAATELDAGFVRSALRAGAVEFLTPPYDAADLRRSLARVASADGPADVGVRIVFLPARATDGASTLALHVAHVVSERLGRPSLLVDCDLECGVTAFRLGLRPTYTLADALARLDAIDDLWDQLTMPWRGAHVLAAPNASACLTAEEEERVPAVLDSAARHYPFVVVDLPAALSEINELILTECDIVNLVCTPDLTSMHLAQRKIHRFREVGRDPDTIRLVLNREGARNAIRSQDVEKIVGLPVAASIPNDYDAVTEAALKGELISGGSDLGKTLHSLACDIAGIEDKPSAVGARGGWARLLRLA